MKVHSVYYRPYYLFIVLERLKWIVNGILKWILFKNQGKLLNLGRGKSLDTLIHSYLVYM